MLHLGCKVGSGLHLKRLYALQEATARQVNGEMFTTLLHRSRFSRILESWPVRRILESLQFTNSKDKHTSHTKTQPGHVTTICIRLKTVWPEAVPFSPPFRCPAFMELRPHAGPCRRCPAFLPFQVVGRRVQAYGGNDPSPSPFAVASPVTWPVGLVVSVSSWEHDGKIKHPLAI